MKKNKNMKKNKKKNMKKNMKTNNKNKSCNISINQADFLILWGKMHRVPAMERLSLTDVGQRSDCAVRPCCRNVLFTYLLASETTRILRISVLQC